LTEVRYKLSGGWVGGGGENCHSNA
jgi:hypothetical protein